METWNTPGTKNDSAQLCYFDKIAGGRSTLVLALKLKAKREFQWTVFKRCEQCFILEMEQQLAIFTVALLNAMGREAMGPPHRSSPNAGFRRFWCRRVEKESTHAMETRRGLGMTWLMSRV